MFDGAVLGLESPSYGCGVFVRGVMAGWMFDGAVPGLERPGCVFFLASVLPAVTIAPIAVIDFSAPGDRRGGFVRPLSSLRCTVGDRF